MSKIYAVQGDSLPLVTLTITDLDDNLVSIAGCTGALRSAPGGAWRYLRPVFRQPPF